MGLDTHIVTPEEIRELSPITNVDGVLGALYDPLMDIWTRQALRAARVARMAGAKWYCEILFKTNARADGTWDVVTQQGTVHAEHIVNAAGLGLVKLGRRQASPTATPYGTPVLVTEDVAEVYDREQELPRHGP